MLWLLLSEYVYVCVWERERERSVMSDSLRPHELYCPPGSSVHGIFQARILEWVATFFSRGRFQPRDRTRMSFVFCIGRRVLYQLSHQGSPKYMIYTKYMICKYVLPFHPLPFHCFFTVCFNSSDPRGRHPWICQKRVHHCKSRGGGECQDLLVMLLLSRFSRVRLYATP